jgi:type I restriction enzyme S subunit
MNSIAPKLPNGWKRARLDEACDVILGQSPPGDTYNAEGKGLPFFQGKAEFGDYYPTPVKWCSAPTKLAEPEDVLISVRAPVGPTNLCPTKACIGRGLAAIRPKQGTPSRYILYALRATVSALVEKGTGSTFEAVNGNDLRAHQIAMAPIDEQPLIV